jgi:RecB family exonuclease
MTTINTWSFSGLLDYEECPLRARFRYIDKIPTEAHPAAERGTKIHDEAEKFVKGEIDDLPKSLSKFGPEFYEWRDAYSEGTVIAEEQWGLTRDCEPCGFFDDNVWWRGLLDLLVLHKDEGRMDILDHKTGKEYPVKHLQQGQLYTFVAFLMFPDYEIANAQMVYLDLGKMSRPVKFNKQQAAKYGANFISRAEKMTSDTEFIPKANRYNCRWCSYKGHCDVAAE